ncbi:peptide ABC transporter substrate-binding protein [Prosthecobacter sp.]|uniref:peptide ABC transporter substrate-binding protein n=1 Tax=Prosthecobacter sp. TaxID=1965333 RepID=UPI001D8DA896|nr:peptide ABC transporter substrate-binding protein [Prosthecobacter sp.]MCB1278104.1 peptide ABC transporter substrate-binding protein [Prosthecobacter sp.]
MIAAMRWFVRAFLLVVFLVGVVWFNHVRTNRPRRIDIATREGILLVGNGTEPATLDPQLATGQPEHHIFHAIFEGLVAPAPDNPDADGPGAAASWTHENFTTWTFKLQPNGKWSDGTPVTAGDFVYAYERMLTAKFGADYANMLFPMLNAEAFYTGKITDFSQVGVKALDALTLQITLAGPAPYLPSMLKHYSWFPVPRHAIEKFGNMTDRNTRWTRPGNLVGNGPFMLKSWRINQSVETIRNPYYWDAASVKLNGVTFIPISSDTTEERAFLDGQLHVTQTLPLAKIPGYRETRPDFYRDEPLLSTYFYRINTTRKPFDNPKVRRALALAIDRESICRNILRAGQKPATGLTPPGCGIGYQPPDVMHFDPNEARKLLAEAGFPDGKSMPTFDILINTNEAHRTIAEAVQSMWKENLHIPVRVLNQDWGVYLESQRKLDYDVCRAGWVGDYLDPSTFLALWKTGDGNNNTGWSSPRYDALLSESFLEGDPVKRFAILHEAETLMLEEVPIIPIYWYVRSFLVQPNVKGLLPSLLEHRCYKAVELVP